MATTRTICLASATGTGKQTAFVDAFGPIAGDLNVDTSGSVLWRVPAPAATWRNMAAYITTNTGATTWNHKLQKAGVNQNQVVPVTGNTTGWFSDASHSDSTSAADQLNYLYTGGNFGAQLCSQNAIECESSSAPTQLMNTANEVSNYSFSTSLTYTPIHGDYGSKSSATEVGLNQHFCRAAGTLSGLFIYLVTALGGSLTGTVKSRKNAADGNQVISVSSAATGVLQDGSHTDSLAATNLYNADWVGTGSGGSGRTFGAWFSGTISAFELWGGGNGTDALAGKTTASFLNLGGQFACSTPETSRQLKVWRGFTISNLRFWVKSASWGTSTGLNVRSRKNAGNGNQLVALTTSDTAAAWYEDGSHTDSLSANDLITESFQVLTNAATQLLIARFGMNFDDGSNAGTDVGTIAQTFSGFSQSAVAGQGETAAIAQTFSGFTQALSGFIKPIGAITQAFSGFTQVLHGIGAPGAPRSTQIVRLAPAEGTPRARSTQAARLAIAGVSPKGRSTQLGRLTIAGVQAVARSTQLARLTIAAAVPCGTQWCQCWRITRKDGLVLRFTSLDEDFDWGSDTFSACASLNPSASESATALGNVGNIELTGIIASSAISAGDLYGGLFDDAFVEVWLVPYVNAGGECPKRIAAGWTGDLSQEAEGSFKMEVIGPGARLGQQALTQAMAPRCRWVFGDSRCGVDREARALTGCSVLFAINRGDFTADIDPGTLSSGGLVSGALSSGADENASQWPNGLVRWVTGKNAGQECELKTIDFESGQIVLWALPAYTPEAGDEFTLLPGCGQAPDDCKFYDNFLNFGGFDDVPGDDSLAQVPDAKL